METKVFTVIDTRTQSKKQFESTATTLGELKQQLSSMGITTDGMSIQEGLTRITLHDDNSILPHDVPYKGTTTNKLVFRLTFTNKKIKSGMDRKELYRIIKENSCQTDIKAAYGKNYTNVSTEELEDYINAHFSLEEPTNTVVNDKSEAVKLLAHILANKGIISSNEESQVLNTFTKTSSLDSLYSKEEIDEMFSEMD